MVCAHTLPKRETEGMWNQLNTCLPPLVDRPTDALEKNLALRSKNRAEALSGHNDVIRTPMRAMTITHAYLRRLLTHDMTLTELLKPDFHALGCRKVASIF